MNVEQAVNDTWKGIGRLGKLHFVFNTYNMAMQGHWFDLIAIYDGYNDNFFVVSDLYNRSFNKSSRKALLELFLIFANENKGNIEYKELYHNLRQYPESTKDIRLERDCSISYIHSSNMQKKIMKYLRLDSEAQDV